MDKLLLTIPEVAEKLGISKSKVNLLVSDGGLPVVRIGRSVRISVEALQTWLAELATRTVKRGSME